MSVLDKFRYFDAIEYEPHTGQKLLHTSDARFKVACCGRRWGKSSSAGHELSYHLMNPADAGNVYWIVGPTYELGEREFEVVHSDIMKLPIAKKCKIAYNVQQGYMRIVMPWGTECKVVSSTHTKSLQGKGLSGVIMSEAAEQTGTIWDQFIRPALADHRGWAIFPSTPKGYNLFYDFYMRGVDTSWDEWDSWRFPTWTNDKIFSGPDDPEIDSMRRSMSELKFAQEVCAEFTTFEGRVYSEFDERVHVRTIEYNPEWKNFWAFDFGYTNPFVCLDIMVDPSDNVYVWREYYERFRANTEHGYALRDRKNPQGFHCDGRFGDPADPGAMAELGKIIGQVFPAKAEWIEGVEAIKNALTIRHLPDDKKQTKLFIDPSCTNLIRQLNQLSVVSQKSEKLDPKEGQKKVDDHAADALRYFGVAYFILGAGSSLRDAYKIMAGNDLESFYQREAGLTTLLEGATTDSFFTMEGMNF